MVHSCALNIASNAQHLLGCIFVLSGGSAKKKQSHATVQWAAGYDARWAALSIAVPWTPKEREHLMRTHIVPLGAAYQNARVDLLPAAFAADGQTVIPNDQRIGRDATDKKFDDETQCRHCGSKTREGDATKKQKLFCCGNCRVAHYCSHQCQKSDWQKHKGWCKASVAAKKALTKKK
jgi:hypothetical protein